MTRRSTDMRTRELTYTATALTFALAAGYFERLLPPILPTLPGVKLGLANLAVVAALYLMGTRAALTVSILKVIITGMLFTGALAAGYAMSGALLSFAVMALLKKSGFFGIFGVSMAGGAAHNAGQLLFAALIMNEYSLLYFLPLLTVSGTISGGVIGLLAGVFIRRVSKMV